MAYLTQAKLCVPAPVLGRWQSELWWAKVREIENTGAVTSELYHLASRLRQVFQGILLATTPTGQTAGTCAYATLLLKLMIEQFTPYRAIPRGGDGLADGGYFDASGRGHGHYWLEVLTDDGDYIIDITADQFGELPVLVVNAVANSNYIPGDQKLVDSHLEELAKSLPH